MAAVAVLGLLFGLSTSFAMAVVVRFSIGIFNGFMSTAKVCITELSKTKEHEVRGFGYLNGAYGLGMVIGPSIGGLLARPAVQYPDVFTVDGLWGRFPYLLPSLVCSLVAAVAFVAIFLFVPETACFEHDEVFLSDTELETDGILTGVEEQCTSQSVDKPIPKNWVEPNASTESAETDGFVQPSASKTILSATIGVGKELKYTPLQVSESGKENLDDDMSELTLEENWTLKERLCACVNTFSYQHINCTKQIQMLFVVYCLFSLLIQYTDEIVPLFCITSMEHGGLGWESAEVGLVLTAVGVGVALFQFFIYEHVMKIFFRYGDADTAYKWMMLTATGMICMPFFVTVVWLFARSLRFETDWMYYLAVMLPSLVYHSSATAVYTSIAMMVNASTDPSYRGMMNGVVMTVGSVGKGLGPITGATLYASVVSANWPTPFDGRIVFLTGTIAMVVLAHFVKRHLVVIE